MNWIWRFVLFQNSMMRARYSSVPVVVAPHGLALGGACELSLHSDKCCPAAENIYRLGGVRCWFDSRRWWYQRVCIKSIG